MKKILDFVFCVFCRLNNLNYVPLLLSRLTVGVIFVGSGLGKFNNLDRVIGYFTSLGMPYPQFLTPFVSFFELICGACILVGFATRFAAVPLIIIMLVAIRTAKWEEVTSVYSIFQLSEFLYIVLLLCLFFQGAGRFSLDHFTSKLMEKTQKCSNNQCNSK